MPTNESWVLDGVSLTSGSFTLMEVNADPPRERPDWISAADSEAAALVRQPLHENRKITMKLRVTPQASMNVALDQVGALVDKLRTASSTPAGVALVWTAANASRNGTFTVLSGEITGMPIALSGDGYSWILSRPILSIEMTCNPYGLGTETLTGTTSSSTPFVAAEITGVTGDVRALGRLIVTDTATQSRRHVEWGLEGPLTYNASTSLLVDSDDMVTSGFGGTQSTQTGAYDPNASGNNVITMSAYKTPMAMAGLGNLSHIGTFAVKARMYGVSNELWVRLSWRVGDGPTTTNDWAVAVFGTVFRELDLGTVTIPAVVSGTQRWTGQIEVMVSPTNTSAGEPGTAKIDYLTLIPTADGYGKTRATFSLSPGVMVGYDAFVGTTAAAALGTRAAPVGGSWAVSGDATDFVFADNFIQSPADAVESLTRSTAVVETTGRYAILGSTNYTNVQVDARIRAPGTNGIEQSLVARWTDASNHVRLVAPDSLVIGGSIRIEQVLAGVVTTLASTTQVRIASTAYRLRLIVFDTGRVLGLFLSDGGVTLATMEAASSTLATGGTLQTGKPGIKDRCLAVTAINRYFTGIAVSTPAAEPIAVYSGRNMQVRYDDVVRQDSAGTYAGPPPSYRGSRFLVPVGTSRVLVKARRNDVETNVDDNVTDATQIQIGWTPRFLAVPR